MAVDPNYVAGSQPVTAPTGPAVTQTNPTPQTQMQGFGYDPSQYISTATNWANNWNNMGNTEYNWAVGQYNNNQSLANQISNTAMGTSGVFDDAARAGVSRYQNMYVPAMQQFLQTAQNYTSPENMARARGMAMANVGQAFDAQADESANRLRSYGLDPNAIASRLDSSVRTQRAAAQAAAGTGSDVQREATGLGLLNTAIGQGTQDANVTNAFGTQGTQNRNQAINTQLATAASRTATAGSPTNWSSMGGTELKEWPKASLDAMTASNQQGSLWNDINRTNLAAQQQQYSQGSGFGALLGAGLGLASNFLLPGSGAVVGPMASAAFGSLTGGGMQGGGAGPLASMGSGMTFAHGGAIDTGQMVPHSAAVPGISGPDKVPAMVQVGEGILPKRVMDHIGQKGLQSIIDKVDRETGRAPQPRAGGQAKPMPRQAMQTGPTFASAGAMG